VYSERDGLELVLRITVALMDDNLETRQMLYILFDHQSTRNVHYTILSNYSICTKNLKNSTLCPPATNHSYEYMLVSMYATLPGTIIEPLTGMARPAKG
jgi:hypothetical protein